jgi:hypothetical protein
MKRRVCQARCKLRWMDAVQLSKEKKAGFEVSNLNCLEPSTTYTPRVALCIGPFQFPLFSMRALARHRGRSVSRRRVHRSAEGPMHNEEA